MSLKKSFESAARRLAQAGLTLDLAAKPTNLLPPKVTKAYGGQEKQTYKLLPITGTAGSVLVIETKVTGMSADYNIYLSVGGAQGKLLDLKLSAMQGPSDKNIQSFVA